MGGKVHLVRISKQGGHIVNSDSTSVARHIKNADPERSAAGQEHVTTDNVDTTSSRWRRRLSRTVPAPLQRVLISIARWAKGPEPPHIWKIIPLFPSVQLMPVNSIRHIAPTRMRKLWLLMALYFTWLLIFITVLDRSAFSETIAGYGTPSQFSCASSFWYDKNGCGLDGNDCRPFSNTSIAFRCPAHCIATQELNPHAVGTQNLIYQPLVVGGSTDLSRSIETAFYRGDSFICAAAVHSGYTSDAKGGCGVVELIGSKSHYPAVASNGIQSFGFDSNFPLSFRFRPGNTGHCVDQRWPLLGVSVVLTALLGLCTLSAKIFFWSTFCILFFHCALVAAPPTAPDYYTLVSVALGKFLPAAACAAIMYHYCVRRTLKGLQAPVEKIVLWLGACWVGVLTDYTFSKIPIQRLTAHDIQQQPGAVPALVVIVVVLLVIVIGQLWAIRQEGRLPRYLTFYASLGICLGLLAAIPHLNLRIHHYILAIILLPGTSLQTRPSLLYQGLLVGLFINGIARWDFDSMLQTSADLISDGQLGSNLPIISQPIIRDQNITFSWDADFPEGMDGLSVLVNDVERFRGYIYDDVRNFTWTSNAPEGDAEYFRFGYMAGSQSQDYTKAGVWNANSTWTTMADGAS